MGQPLCYNTDRKTKNHQKKGATSMNILWYLSVCSIFFGGGYAISKREENKRLRAQLQQMENQPEIPRQFVNLTA